MTMAIVLLADVSEQIAAVAGRWKRQYFVGGTWRTTRTGSSEHIYQGLVALPATATAADVAAIIGNSSWVGHQCNECGEGADVAFQLGQEPDYESHTVTVCAVCAKVYAEFIQAAIAKQEGR